MLQHALHGGHDGGWKQCSCSAPVAQRSSLLFLGIAVAPKQAARCSPASGWRGSWSPQARKRRISLVRAFVCDPSTSSLLHRCATGHSRGNRSGRGSQAPTICAPASNLSCVHLLEFNVPTRTARRCSCTSCRRRRLLPSCHPSGSSPPNPPASAPFVPPASAGTHPIEMRPKIRPSTALAVAALALLAAVAPAAAVPHATVQAGSAADFAAAAHSLDSGGRLTVIGYRLEGEEGAATLQLKHHQVWAPGAKVVVHTAEGTTEAPPPAARIFRGTIEGQTGSSVLLSVQEDGRMTGMAMRGDASWALGHEEQGSDSDASLPGGRRRLLSLGSRRARLQEEEEAQPEDATKPKSRRCGNRPGHSHGPERHQPDASAFLQNAARKLAQVRLGLEA